MKKIEKGYDPRGEPTVRIETVTKAMCEEWLTHPKSTNRPLRQKHVRDYMAILRRGEGEISGQAIVICEDGGMLDGQHRCMAMATLGGEYRCVVMRGARRVVQKITDGGDVRTPAQNLALQGVIDGGFVARWFNEGRKLLTHHSDKASNHEFDAYVAAYGAALDFGREWAHRAGPTTKRGVLGALVYAYPACPDRVVLFTEALASGAGLAVDSPVLALLKYLNDDTSCVKGDNTRDVGLKVLRCVRAYAAGETLSSKHVYAQESTLEAFACGHPASSPLRRGPA